MEIGHILISQAIFFSSIMATIAVSESPRSAASIRCLYELPFIRVSGEKGAIMLLFAVSTLVLIAADLLSSQAKVCGMKKMHKRARMARKYQIQNILVAFMSFICAYIFQSLNFRIYNLLGLALVVMNIKTIILILHLTVVTTWLYFVFIMCNILILCFTFLRNFEQGYSMAVSLLRMRLE